MSIPVIDVSAALDPDGRERRAVAAQIQAAAQTSGFFYVTGHGVAQELIKRQFEAAAQFFSLPLEHKQRVSIRNSAAMRGFETLGSQTLDASANADLKESFQYGLEYPASHPYVLKGYSSYGQNQWPQDLPQFESTCSEYYSAVEKLSSQLMQLLALSLDLPENYFDRLNRHPSDMLRLLRYPPQPETADARTFGAGAHTDWGALTVLAQDSHGGLEVQMPDGTWVQALPIAGSFVVNLGDMIPRWTNDRYRSNPHRVRNTNSHGKHRFSVVFFADLDYEARIEPIATAMTDQEAPRYAPCTVGEHMEEKYRTTYGAA